MTSPAHAGTLMWMLSNDTPRNRLLTALIVILVFGLVIAPFAFPGARTMNTAAKILVFIVLVASYDLILGYAGIISFAHTMFFGIGAYGVAIAMSRMEPGWTALMIGSAAALTVSAVLAMVIGLFSLRVRTVFFAMITLAVANAFTTLASQMSDWTGGEDGINFKMPSIFSRDIGFWISLSLVLSSTVACFPITLLLWPWSYCSC